MSEQIIGNDVAEAEYARFIDANEIEVDLDSLKEEDRKSYLDQKSKIIRAMCRGRLVITEEGLPKYTPQDGGPLTFKEPTGAAFMALDLHREGQSVHKQYAVMAAMTETDSKRFAKMPNRDLKVCLAITAIFLAD